MKRKWVINRRFSLLAAIVALILATVVAPHHAQEQRALYLDPNGPLEARVEDLLSRLTLAEKLALVHADSKFTTAAIPRLGIPRRWLSDGPHAKMSARTTGNRLDAPTTSRASCRP